jgi:inorganic pyrophosphatase
MNPDALRKDAPLVEVIIEIPRGSVLKRGSTGELDFISPLPCLFNYGSIPALIGLDGDLLDAVVLGPRLSLGTTIRVPAWGAVGMIDGGV